MEARYFRYLFQNVPDGMMQCGYIDDTINREKLFYVYLSENQEKHTSTNTYCTVSEALSRLPQEDIDLLVLSNFKLLYITSMLELVKTHTVDTVVLPYAAPTERNMEQSLGEEVKGFLTDPYTILKDLGVKNVYSVYDNGETISTPPDTIQAGSYFEDTGKEIQDLVNEMEGKPIPVVKAGYMVKCGWLFYFGCYGMKLSAAMKQNDIGTESRSTITMFAGPLNDSPKQVDSLFTAKTFTKEMQCRPGSLLNDSCCDYKCMRYQDHDNIKRHTNQKEEVSSFGLLLIGNLDLKTYIKEFTNRYSGIAKRVRVTNIPDSGVSEKWNAQIMEMFEGCDYHYWVTAINERTSAEVLKEILESNSYYRIMNVNTEYGCCFSGYLVDREK